VETGGRSCGNFSLHLEIRNVTPDRFPQTRILKSNLNIGLEVTQGIASIVVLAFEANTEKTLILAK
jgi:hypothetical protein